MIVAGVDGCRGGWLCVSGDPSQPARLDARLLATPDELVHLTPRPDCIGVDIPIGLPESGPRACDRAARARLGRPRGSSVFPAPLRAMLAAGDYAQACAIGRARSGRALSRQAFNLLPAIAAMDRFLQTDSGLAGRIHEVHPECSFQAWNTGVAMPANKKTPAGIHQRTALIDRDYAGARAAAMAQLPPRSYATDDLLDAFAVFHTAQRIARGLADCVLAEHHRDAHGLLMQIWV